MAESNTAEVYYDMKADREITEKIEIYYFDHGNSAYDLS